MLTGRVQLSALALALGISTAAVSAPPQQVYAQRCLMCHQAKGAGLPGQFPRLAGRLPVIARAPEGRRYLLLVLLHGMVGTMNVDGKPIAGLMPSMAALPDEDIAGVLNHVVGFAPAAGKKPAAFTPAEVAAARKSGAMSSSQVGAERARLVGSKVIP